MKDIFRRPLWFLQKSNTESEDGEYVVEHDIVMETEEDDDDLKVREQK